MLEQYLEQNHIASSALIAVFKGGESHYFRQVSESLKLKFGSRVLIKIIDQIDFYQDEFQLNLPEVLQQNQSKISGLICGSSYLVNQCKSLYKDYGLTEDNISYDEFI